MLYDNVLITGGAGFIGSHLVRHFVSKYPKTNFINVDALTYAGNLSTIKDIIDAPNHVFEHININDKPAINNIFSKYNIDAVIHTAAESHVDNSILNPDIFLNTNVLGTLNLLNIAHQFWKNSNHSHLFHHISTDEVFGSLDNTNSFTETSPYAPRSPYSASKAAADHWVMAYFHTFQLPVIITYCSNNYGSHQYPEKLIPTMIKMNLNKKPLSLYGNGNNIRDWIYVEDHINAIDMVFNKGIKGEKYCIGATQESTNLELTKKICHLMDKKLNSSIDSTSLIQFIPDRLGHDYRYAINNNKIKSELGWKPNITLEKGLSKTIDWYLNNRNWLDEVSNKKK